MSTLMGAKNFGKVDNSFCEEDDSNNEVVGNANDIMSDKASWTKRQIAMMADLRKQQKEFSKKEKEETHSKLMSHANMLERDGDSNLGNYESSDFRLKNGASVLNTEGQELQLPHLPAIEKNPIQNIKLILEMLPESGEISSLDDEDDHDIHNDT